MLIFRNILISSERLIYCPGNTELLKSVKYSVGVFFVFILIISCSPNNYSTRNYNDHIINLSNWQYLSATKLKGINVSQQDIDEALASEEWIKISSGNKIKKNYDDEIIFLKTTLPDWHGEDPSLYLGQTSYSFKILLNKKIIYQWGGFNNSSNKYIRWNQNFVPLPYYTSGSEIIFIIMMGKEYNGLFKKVLLGSSLKIMETIFSNDLISFILLIIFFFTGTIVFFIYFFLHRTKLLAELFLLLISITTLIFVNLSFVQLFLKAPVLFFHLNYIFLGVGAVSIFLLIEEIVIDKYKFLIGLLWKARLTILLLTIVLINTTELIYNDLAKYVTISTIMGFVIAIFIIFLSAVKSKYESKIIFAGIISVAFSAIIEIIIFLERGVVNTEFGYKIIIIPFGILLFVISIIWVAIHNYRETNLEKENNKQKAFELMKRENEARQSFALKLIESQENERSRIAIELHDSVGQKLLLIKNRIQNVIDNLFVEAGKESLMDINSLTGETIKEIRNITGNLHPAVLEQVGLTSAIEGLVEKVSKHSKIDFYVFIDNIDQLIPKKDEINFYRIVQESLSNIIKHSRASEAFIKIEKVNEQIILEIKDDGIGTTETKLNNNGIGIAGMKERAAILGSGISIDSSEKGTTIKMEYNIIK